MHRLLWILKIHYRIHRNQPVDFTTILIAPTKCRINRIFSVSRLSMSFSLNTQVSLSYFKVVFLITLPAPKFVLIMLRLPKDSITADARNGNGIRKKALEYKPVGQRNPDRLT